MGKMTVTIATMKGERKKMRGRDGWVKVLLPARPRALLGCRALLWQAPSEITFNFFLVYDFPR